MAKFKKIRQSPVEGMSETQYYKRQKEMKETGELPEGMTLKEFLSPSNEEVDSSSEPKNLNEDVEVDNHTETESGFGSLIGRARESLLNNLDAPEKAKRGRKPGGALAGKDDFLALVVSLITLAVTFIKVDDRLKPNKDEITSFSDHLAGIILRHSSISGKLSADAMAVLGMVMVGAAYYQRITPYLHEGREQPYQTQYSPARETAQPDEPIVLTKITQASANFLDNAVETHREEQ